MTDGKRGLAGIGIVVMSGEMAPWMPTPASTKTDAEGRYRLNGLAPGRYHVAPVAPAHIMPEEGFGFIGRQQGRSLILNPGENIENVDFRLTRGGVITGRVTGDDGKPVVGEFVQITPEEGNRPAHQSFRPDRSEMQTDDRGVYRVYGLPAGRYRVSVGCDRAAARPAQRRRQRRADLLPAHLLPRHHRHGAGQDRRGRGGRRSHRHRHLRVEDDAADLQRVGPTGLRGDGAARGERPRRLRHAGARRQGHGRRVRRVRGRPRTRS